MVGGLGAADGLTWDKFGRLFISDAKAKRIFVIPRPDQKPVQLADGFESIADMAVDPSGKSVLVVDRKAGSIARVPITIPGAEVDETPLALETAVAFPKLKWTGWEPETPKARSCRCGPSC